MDTDTLIERAKQRRIALGLAYEVIAGIDETGRDYAVAPYQAYLASDASEAMFLANAKKRGLTIRKITVEAKQ